ncbi:MAG: hypothetical protein IT441_10095 [Phycisphaeraceae bacterium]|nr:hypothetical protein [Phycisphaeraceae bacterium]
MLADMITELVNDPHRQHAALVHFPVAVAFLGLVLLIIFLINLGRSSPLRWSIVAVYLLGLIAAVLAMRAGHASEEHILDQLHVQLAPAAQEMLSDHEEMGEGVWMTLALPALLVAFSAIRPLRVAGAVIALLAGLVAAGWIGYTAYLGGNLVYAHGVGVPPMTTPAPPPPAPVVVEPAPAPKPTPKPAPVHVAPEPAPAPATQPVLEPEPQPAAEPSDADAKPRPDWRPGSKQTVFKRTAP